VQNSIAFELVLQYFFIQMKYRRITIDLEELGLPGVPLVGKSNIDSAEDGLVTHIHHGLMEICYMSKGERVYNVAGRDYRMRGNEFFITEPNERHGSGKNPHGKGMLYWMQVAIPAKPRPFLTLSGKEAFPLLTQLGCISRRCFPGHKRVAGIFEEIIELELSAEQPLNRLTIANLVIEFLLLVISCSKSQDPTGLSTDIAELIKKLESDPSANYSIMELAEFAGLSESRFKAKFKEQTGIPPSEFMLRNKIEKAIEMLREGKFSITEIAFRLGFSSSQYFSTVFKRFTNQTPKEKRSS
jgi:AraC-like DNA-binding protein